MAKSDEDQKRASSKDFPSDPTYPQEREGRGEPHTDDEYFPSIREGEGAKLSVKVPSRFAGGEEWNSTIGTNPTEIKLK